MNIRASGPTVSNIEPGNNVAGTTKRIGMIKVRSIGNRIEDTYGRRIIKFLILFITIILPPTTGNVETKKDYL